MSNNPDPKITRRTVDFAVLQNQPAKLQLEDGTVIVVQMVPMRVTCTSEKLPDGQFRHEFNIQHVIDQIAPEKPVTLDSLKGDKS